MFQPTYNKGHIRVTTRYNLHTNLVLNSWDILAYSPFTFTLPNGSPVGCTLRILQWTFLWLRPMRMKDKFHEDLSGAKSPISRHGTCRYRADDASKKHKISDLYHEHRYKYP